MEQNFVFTQFSQRFPTDAVCLEEIKKLRYPSGIFCIGCQEITKHYKVQGRTSYCCKICRRQIYPLADTIFSKTATPLRLWFYAMYLMTQTRADMSITKLQKELGVTYKTAWRMYKRIRMLMAQNNGDLLAEKVEINKVLKWTFFNKFEFSLTEKKEKKI